MPMPTSDKPMSTTTRRTLLARLKDLEDLGAWSEFFDIYAPILYRFARAHGLSICDAEEIRDQCLERVVRHIKSFDYDTEKGRFRGYLFQLVRAKIIDRQRRRSEAPLEDEVLQTLPDEAETPQSRWDRSILDEHIRRALEMFAMTSPSVITRHSSFFSAERPSTKSAGHSTSTRTRSTRRRVEFWGS